MRIGITCYPTYGGSGVVATELGIELAALGPRGALHLVLAALQAGRARPKGIYYHEVPVRAIRLRVPALRPGAGLAYGRSG